MNALDGQCLAQHEGWMREALAEAVLAGDDVPVGAVVVSEGQVIARAHNQREDTQNPLAHAEVLALSRAAQDLGTRRLDGCTLYVTLEPCPMCAGALLLSGIKLCVFGAYDTAYGCCGSVYALPMDPAFHHHVPCVGGILEAECARLIRAFFGPFRESRAQANIP